MIDLTCLEGRAPRDRNRGRTWVDNEKAPRPEPGVAELRPPSPVRGKLSLQPDKRMYLAPIRPLVGVRYQPLPYRIFTHVMPFFREMGGISDLGIPIIPLPNRFLPRKWPFPSGGGPPELSPGLIPGLQIGGRTEIVNMIRHQHIPVHLPMIRAVPDIPEQGMYLVARE